MPTLGQTTQGNAGSLNPWYAVQTQAYTPPGAGQVRFTSISFWAVLAGNVVVGIYDSANNLLVSAVVNAIVGLNTVNINPITVPKQAFRFGIQPQTSEAISIDTNSNPLAPYMTYNYNGTLPAVFVREADYTWHNIAIYATYDEVVGGPLSVSASALTPTTITGPGQVTFQAAVAGGTPPYTYQWKDRETGVVPDATQNPQAIDFPQVTVQTLYNIYVTVTDSLGASANSSPDIPVTINPVPQETKIVDPCEADTLASWEAAFLDGTPIPLNISADVPPGIVSAGSLQAQIPALAGQWYAYMTKSLGAVDWTGFPYLIFPFKLSRINPIPPYVQLGFLNASGLWFAAIYELTGLTANTWKNIVIDLNNPTKMINDVGTVITPIPIEFARLSTLEFYIGVDSQAITVNIDEIKVIGTAPPPPPLLPSITVSPTSADLYTNQYQDFVATPEGGTPGYTVTWIDEISGNVLGTGTSYRFGPVGSGNAGIYRLYAHVEDAAGQIADSPLVVITVTEELITGITPWSLELELGTYEITMPTQVQIGSDIYNFKQWEDGSTNPVRTINLTLDMTITATYQKEAPPLYTLTISATAGGTTNPSAGTYPYTEGQQAQITAIPDANYRFANWNIDGTVRTENPITILMDQNHTLRAVFEYVPPPPITHLLVAESTPITGVQIKVDGANYVTPTLPLELQEGIHTVEVPSNVTVGTEIYNFVKWEDDSTNPSRNINLTANTTIMATYQLAPPPPPQKGKLEVHAFLDSQEIVIPYEVTETMATGMTPATIELDPGTYTIKATLGTETKTEIAQVLEDQTVRVDFKFEVLPTPPIAIVPVVSATAGLILTGIALS